MNVLIELMHKSTSTRTEIMVPTRVVPYDCNSHSMPPKMTLPRGNTTTLYTPWALVLQTAMYAWCEIPCVSVTINKVVKTENCSYIFVMVVVVVEGFDTDRIKSCISHIIIYIWLIPQE